MWQCCPFLTRNIFSCGKTFRTGRELFYISEGLCFIVCEQKKMRNKNIVLHITSKFVKTSKLKNSFSLAIVA